MCWMCPSAEVQAVRCLAAGRGVLLHVRRLSLRIPSLPMDEETAVEKAKHLRARLVEAEKMVGTHLHRMPVQSFLEYFILVSLSVEISERIQVLIPYVRYA